MKLRLAGVGKMYAGKEGPFTALEGVDLEIGEGEFVCLVGPSGCGKSTLLNLVAGFERPDEGSVTCDGRPADGDTLGRVMIFQEPALFPWLSVRGNVEFGLKMARVPKKRRVERAAAYLKMVHLSRFADAAVHELSGGMRQRAALARALTLSPDVLLMDEPFAALDAQTRDMLHELLLEIWAKTGKTILFVTHNVREAVFLADRVVVLGVRPGTVRREFGVPIARPRDPADPDVARLAGLVLDELKEEVDKIAREEFDTDWARARAHVVSAACGDMGSGI